MVRSTQTLELLCAAYTPDGLDAGYTVTTANGTEITRVETRDPCRRELISAITNTAQAVSAPAPEARSSFAYAYDALGRVVSRAEPHGPSTFSYNPRSEVASASFVDNLPSPINHSHSYDSVGNHVNPSRAPNALNQYAGAGSSHDLDGNLTSAAASTYAYDSLNRLSAVFTNAAFASSFAYDHAGRRVTKWTQNAVRTFVHDDWNLIAELSADRSSSTTATNLFVWGQDLSGTMQGAGGVGGLLATRMYGNWYFPLYDHNGNITEYLDASGNVVAQYRYDAFGSTVSSSGGQSRAFRHRFSTKPLCAYTGLYYYGHRFYDPYTGRFTNRDPIEEQGGLNLYAFCGNDPVNKWDYLGMNAGSKEPSSNKIKVEFVFEAWYIDDGKIKKNITLVVDAFASMFTGPVAVPLRTSSSGETFYITCSSSGTLTVRMFPKIGYPDEVGPPAGYTAKVPKYWDNSGSVSGFAAEVVLPNATGLSQKDLYGSASKIGNNGTLAFPDGYPTYRYDNPRFAIGREIYTKTGASWTMNESAHELFQTWDTKLHSPIGENASKTVRVSIGDTVHIKMRNIGEWEFNTIYTIRFKSGR